MATSADLRIGAEVHLSIYRGETFLCTFKIKDKAGDYINWTGATIGDFKIFRSDSTDLTYSIPSADITVDASGHLLIDKSLSDADIPKGRFKYEWALTPAGGGPRGIVNGKLTVYDRG